jgi:hypothetical protein
VDAGAVGTTVLSLGGRSGRTQLGGDRWVAIGSSSGVVNIYDRRDWAAAYANAAEKDVQNGVPRNPVPARALDQLTTPISHLVFAPDGQMLAMASRWKRDALRLGMFLSFPFLSFPVLSFPFLSFPLGNRFFPFTNDFFFSPSPLLHRLQELAYIQHTPRPNFIRGYLA